MNYTIDHCDPFLDGSNNIWMKLEHLGRYLFACDEIRRRGLCKVLDAACAEGYGLELLEEAGLKTYGADIEPEYVATAAKRTGAVLKVLDFDKADWPEEFTGLDAAVCFETIEHVKDPGMLLAHLNESLKPGGLLMLSVPSDRFEKTDEHGNNFDPFHRHIFTDEEVRTMLGEAGFEIEAVYGQALCNDMYAAEKAAIERGAFKEEDSSADAADTARIEDAKGTACTADMLFSYDRDALIKLSHLMGYPNQIRIEDSYSHIYIASKRMI